MKMILLLLAIVLGITVTTYGQSAPQKPAPEKEQLNIKGGTQAVIQTQPVVFQPLQIPPGLASAEAPVAAPKVNPAINTRILPGTTPGAAPSQGSERPLNLDAVQKKISEAAKKVPTQQ
ncbi:hypothetical protein ACWKWU_22740 [Chitinophaga lutea]